MKVFIGIFAVTLVALSSAGPAAAAGCNGVVNQLVWGCAAWDNNNGPKYPNYKAPVRSSNPVVRGNVPNLNNPGIVAGGAGNIVAGGAGNIVAGGAGNVIAASPNK